MKTKWVIVYDDADSSRRAREFCDSLRWNQGDLALVMWKFDVLETAAMRQLAVEDAAEAEVIVVAATEGNELPPAVRSWIAGWLLDRGDQGTDLVALLACWPTLSDGRAPVRDYLQKAAEVACIKFTCSETNAEISRPRTPIPERANWSDQWSPT